MSLENVKVEVQEEWFSVEQCEANPNKLYIFGDNSVGEGKGGQAIIRDCKNSFGIPTKRYPTLDESAFFDDVTTLDVLSFADALIELSETKEAWTVVFPKDGIGTGLARMSETAPKLFEILCMFMDEEFGLTMTKDGFI